MYSFHNCHSALIISSVSDNVYQCLKICNEMHGIYINAEIEKIKRHTVHHTEYILPRYVYVGEGQVVMRIEITIKYKSFSHVLLSIGFLRKIGMLSGR